MGNEGGSLTVTPRRPSASVPVSELDEVVERSRVRHIRRAQDGPLVKVVRRGNLFERPPEIRDEERRCVRNGRELVIVDHHDRTLVNEAAGIDEVDEDTVEAVIAVDKGKVERPSLAEEAREGNLRFLFVMLDQPGDARLVEELQAEVGEACCLVRVDGDVMCLRLTGFKQALTNEQRRDA